MLLSNIPDKSEAISCHFDVSSYRYDTESKICAIAHSYVTLCARTAMFLPFDLAQIFQDHEDRCRELSRELHKLCNLSRNA